MQSEHARFIGMCIRVCMDAIHKRKQHYLRYARNRNTLRTAKVTDSLTNRIRWCQDATDTLASFSS